MKNNEAESYFPEHFRTRSKLEKLAIMLGKVQRQKTRLAEGGNHINMVGQSTKAYEQKLSKQKRMDGGVPEQEMSPNKVEQRAIGLGMDEEQRSRMAEHENIENKVGRSKISKDT